MMNQLELSTVLQEPRKELLRQIHLNIDLERSIEEFLLRGVLTIPCAAQFYCPFTANLTITELTLEVHRDSHSVILRMSG